MQTTTSDELFQQSDLPSRCLSSHRESVRADFGQRRNFGTQLPRHCVRVDDLDFVSAGRLDDCPEESGIVRERRLPRAVDACDEG